MSNITASSNTSCPEENNVMASTVEAFLLLKHAIS
jgi:hypothetical protein